MRLDKVTLICVDTDHPIAGLRAVQICRRQIEFAETFFVTNESFASTEQCSGIEFIGVPAFTSGHDYSRMLIKELSGIVETSHALIVQWDGYVLDVSAWDDKFLKFDYIGSPWAVPNNGRRVGNGGFSLRSKKLLDALARPEIPCMHPEDVAICVTLRPQLEAMGIRFADDHTASQFSLEQIASSSPTFGFHGAFNLWQTIHSEELKAILGEMPGYVLDTPPIAHLIKAYASRQRWREARIVLDAMEAKLTDSALLKSLSVISGDSLAGAEAVRRDIILMSA